MAKNLTSLVGGTVIAAGLMAVPAYAHHNCAELGKESAKFVDEVTHPEGGYTKYDDNEQEAPLGYSYCVVRTFKAELSTRDPSRAKNYRLVAIRNHPIANGGTIYLIEKKE